MSRGYHLTLEARANVDEMAPIIAQDNVDAALRVLNALEHAFERSPPHLKSVTGETISGPAR